mmetsp:Transcript_23276/g.72516  ORF Transcript_23276/g.72516 Transcript_23276/m.72516 type:complete len:348 (+) Transcript_23276:341-1384(+)
MPSMRPRRSCRWSAWLASRARSCCSRARAAWAFSASSCRSAASFLAVLSSTRPLARAASRRASSSCRSASWRSSRAAPQRSSPRWSSPRTAATSSRSCSSDSRRLASSRVLASSVCTRSSATAARCSAACSSRRARASSWPEASPPARRARSSASAEAWRCCSARQRSSAPCAPRRCDAHCSLSSATWALALCSSVSCSSRPAAWALSSLSSSSLFCAAPRSCCSSESLTSEVRCASCSWCLTAWPDAFSALRDSCNRLSCSLADLRASCRSPAFRSAAVARCERLSSAFERPSSAASFCSRRLVSSRPRRSFSFWSRCSSAWASSRAFLSCASSSRLPAEMEETLS